MKNEMVFLVISLLLLNINSVSSLEDFESSSCSDIYTMSYTIGGGGEFELDCSDAAENYASNPDLCKNEVTLQHILQQGDQRGYAFRDYVDSEGDDFDYDIYYYPNDIEIFSNLNPCTKCGTYFEGLDPSCKGYLVGETRHCHGYPMVGRCAAATEEYLGTEYIYNTYGYNRLYADDAPDLLWDECTYDWNLNTQEICGNNLDDDCDGQIDEGCVGGCLQAQEFCTNNEDGCCPGLVCYGDVQKICLTCRSEGQVCYDDGDCCNRPCDGTNDQGQNTCGCPEGFEWNPISEYCEYTAAECYYTEECPVRPEVNFIQWLGTPGCFADLFRNPGQQTYVKACCPIEPGEDYDTIYSFDFPESDIVVS